MAQTGGLLISQVEDFTQRVVLAKVSRAEFLSIAQPGDQLRLIARVLSLQSEGAAVAGRIEVGRRLVAEMELTFAILDETYGQQSFFNPGDLYRILRSMRLFEVGVTADGRPIPVPPYMLQAEREEGPVLSNSPLS